MVSVTRCDVKRWTIAHRLLLGRKAAAAPELPPRRAHADAMDREASTAPTLEEPLLTAAEVARLLAVPRSSVYEYARRVRDPLPCLQIGRHRRFYRSAIEASLARQAPTA